MLYDKSIRFDANAHYSGSNVGQRGYSASLEKWSIKNSPINRFAVWRPMDMEECSQLLAGVRSVDDPLMRMD
jgi:hypothetical protein